MPLVRISVLQGPEGFGRKVGQVVYRTMVETIDVPRDDNFQVITEHSRDTLVFDRTYMGIARTTYLIDAEGKVARRWDKVKVDGHAEEILDAVKAL